MEPITAAEARKMADESSWLLNTINDDIIEFASMGLTSYRFDLSGERSQSNIDKVLESLKYLGFTAHVVEPEDASKKYLTIYW